MKKFILWALALLIIAAISLTIYMTTARNTDKDFVDPSLTSKKDNMKNLIQTSKAVVYYTTTIDVAQKDRESWALFISKDHQASVHRMKGLDLGTLYYEPQEKTLLLEDSDSLQFVTDDGIQKQTFSQKEHTGTSVGYLTKKQTFYSMNNTGILESKNKGYESTLRYGNAQKVNSTTIPEWVQATADNGLDTIYSLVNYIPDESGSEYFRIVQSTLDDTHVFPTHTLGEIMKFSDTQSPTLLSNMYYDAQHLYGIISYSSDKDEDSIHYDILDYDIVNKTVNRHEIASYKNQLLIQMGIHQGGSFQNKRLYFVEADGNVEQIHVKTHQAKTLYNLNALYGYDDFSNPQEHQLYMDDKFIYYFYYDHEGQYYLDQIVLQTGKRIASNRIEHAKELLESQTQLVPNALVAIPE